MLIRHALYRWMQPIYIWAYGWIRPNKSLNNSFCFYRFYSMHFESFTKLRTKRANFSSGQAEKRTHVGDVVFSCGVSRQQMNWRKRMFHIYLYINYYNEADLAVCLQDVFVSLVSIFYRPCRHLAVRWTYLSGRGARPLFAWNDKRCSHRWSNWQTSWLCKMM